jgi:hypothetical protein
VQALHEMHKILGQVDIVGSPIVLGSSLLAGFRMLISEPAKARNAEEFVEGLGRGLLALSKNALFGFCNATGQVFSPSPGWTGQYRTVMGLQAKTFFVCGVLLRSLAAWPRGWLC